MKNIRNKDSFFFFLILLGILCSIILSSLYFSRIENKLTKEFIGLKFVLQTEIAHETNLLFTYNQKFGSNYVLNDLSPAKDTLQFTFPKSDKVIKKFRLDFGNDIDIKPLKIKELRLIFTSDEIVVDEEGLIQKLFNTSASVSLDKENRIIDFHKDVVPFDPYIIFSPMVEFTIDKRGYALHLLGPFVILLCMFLVVYRGTLKSNFNEILFIIFICCIPLKIAWTTFSAILLGAYGLFNTIINKNVRGEKYLAFFYLGTFIVLLLFGRPSSFSDIDMQLGLLLWAMISITTPIPKTVIYKFYIKFFIFLYAIIIVSGTSFLLWFNNLYGLQLADYFSNIKIYSRDIRSWLYYDHAAFLSFFGITGILFLHKLYKKKLVDLSMVWLYHFLLIFFILITATRIGLVIYVFVLLNVLIKLNYKARLVMNTFILAVFSTFLFSYVDDIDKNRSILWETSLDVIKTHPFFGHGLGQSNQTLHTAYSGNDNIGSPLLELNHSHNQYLTYLLELGIIGFSILVVGLLYFLYKTKQYKNTRIMIYLFALGLLFLTESGLQTSKPLYVLSFLFLLMYNKTNNDFNGIQHQ